MKHIIVSVTEFRTRCLALLNDIGTRGGTITITKHGRPIATVSQAQELAWKSPEASWIGKVSLLAADER